MTAPIVLSILLAAVSAAPSPPSHSKAAILPIVDCPDTPFPQVILAPSVGGHDLAANEYVVCFRGQPLVFTCAEGLFFNWSTMTCDYPYERTKLDVKTSIKLNESSSEEDLDLDPIGPIPVPILPQEPVPWRHVGGNYFPFPPYPTTKPDPSVIRPIPVYPQFPFPQYPITKPDPSVLLPIPVLPAHPPPYFPGRPVPYYYYP